VQTLDFAAVARDLPTLVAPLEPLAEQWEPMGHFPVYQVLLRGTTKVEYLFLEHSQDAMPPVNPSKETLVAINTHFWDWIWWLATKATVGRHDLVAGAFDPLWALAASNGRGNRAGKHRRGDPRVLGSPRRTRTAVRPLGA
jgi:hypothetical protein